MKRFFRRLLALVLCCAVMICAVPRAGAMRIITGNQADIYVRPQAGKVAQVAMSADHVAVLRSDGTVAAAGKNDRNQCGVSGWKQVVKIWACEGATVGMTREGKVLCTFGTLNDWNNIVDVSMRRLENPALVVVTGLRANGTVICATGLQNASGVFLPAVTNVGFWKNIVQVVMSDKIYGLTNRGTVVETAFSNLTTAEIPTSTWKGVEKLVPGNGSVYGITDRGAVLSTSSFYGCENWKNVKSITPGYLDSIFGITAQGTVLAGGEVMKDFSSLTDVQALAPGAERVAALNSLGTVTFFPEVPGLPWELQERWTQITDLCYEPGFGTLAGLRADGEVVACYIDYPTSPAACDGWQSIAKLYRRGELYVGLKTDGTLICSDEALDLSSLTEGVKDTRPEDQPQDLISAGAFHSAYIRSDGSVYAAGLSDDKRLAVEDWQDITALSAWSHTVGLTSAGLVVATGSNSHGQCNVSGWLDMIQVSAGGVNTVGITSKGVVCVVGSNEYGQMALDGQEGITQVSAGGAAVYALTDKGTVLAAGSNANGQSNVSAWAGIVQVSGGGAHVVGLKADGTVVATGLNDQGQCEVSQWKDIVAVSAGTSHTVGLREDGTLVYAGSNEFGQCDLQGEGIIAIGAGMYHTLALLESGEIIGCGSNEFGQLNLIP